MVLADTASTHTWAMYTQYGSIYLQWTRHQGCSRCSLCWLFLQCILQLRIHKHATNVEWEKERERNEFGWSLKIVGCELINMFSLPFAPYAVDAANNLVRVVMYANTLRNSRSAFECSAIIIDRCNAIYIGVVIREQSRGNQRFYRFSICSQRVH